ncbi:8773_t:CDS:2, partial [Dentiscutata erythropus]
MENDNEQSHFEEEKRLKLKDDSESSEDFDNKEDELLNHQDDKNELLNHQDDKNDGTQR